MGIVDVGGEGPQRLSGEELSQRRQNEGRNQSGGISPHDIQVYILVSMNQSIAGTDNVTPRDIRIYRPCCGSHF